MKTDWKEDILAPSMQGKRRYHIYENEDASISLIDSTEYDQVGDVFGANELNQIGLEINSTVEMLTSAVQTAQASAESAQASADRAMQGTPEGYYEFVSNTESHLSTLDQSVGNHENLLDNPWFTVNQRGQSEYVGSKYTFDRWHGSTNGTITKDDGILTYSSNSAGDSFLENRYYFDGNVYGGKEYTASILFGDGTIKSKTFTMPISSTASTLLGTCFDENENGLRIYRRPDTAEYNFMMQIRVLSNTSVSFKAIKLELGTVSTLATDTPPNYELEKYKCTMSTADPSDTYANGGMIKGTLSAGATSVTITDSRITTDSVFRFFTSKFGISPTACTVNNGAVILTFEAQSEPITVGVKLE